MINSPHIAFLCHPYHRGGVTRWMVDSALAYAKKGVTVYFVTVEPVRDFISAKGRETLLQLLDKEANNIHVITAKVGSEFEFGTQAYRADIYRKLLLKLPHGTPVILADDNALWEAAAFVKDSYPAIGVLHADEAYYYNLAKRHWAEVAALVCVSTRIHKTVAQMIPAFDASCIYTIPCGINMPDMSAIVSASSILQLVYAGRVSDFQKRTSDLVKISELLRKRNVDFHLNIIGDGTSKTDLENKFKEAGLQKYVTFSGWRSQQEVAKFLSASDILVLTSDFEGTPIAMMEALAMGCGFTGTRVSGIEDYEHNPLAGECLSVYTVGDIEDAVNKISRIAVVPVQVRKHAARKLAEAEFSMDTCLEKYSKVMTTLKPVSGQGSVAGLPLSQLVYSRILAMARYLKVRLTS